MKRNGLKCDDQKIKGGYVAQLTKATGEQEFIHPKNGKTFILDEIQGYVGGNFQHVPLMNPFSEFDVMLCDEDGIANKKQINIYATILAHQPILGDVMTCRLVEGEYVE